jgi:hypothetical protein
VLDTEAGARITFNDARRFGAMDLVPTADAEGHWLLKDLGPEPLGNAFHEDHLAQAFRGKRTPVKAALLDQRIVAGLGNIYVCEALHRAHISPLRHAGRIARPRIARLVADHPRRADRGDRGRRLVPPGLPAGGWRPGLFPAQFQGLRPRGRALPNPRLPWRHPPQGAVRAVEFLLPDLPKIA